jgi:hypothetical protein
MFIDRIGVIDDFKWECILIYYHNRCLGVVVCILACYAKGSIAAHYKHLCA